ncbi:unnamed protein product [Diatraea saccharalis]|uniref:FP protein C-terminal domain-containing protein n=1 Tax=Diatraea saccharalis TaxID=40085 RepID=A0A9N9RBA4_9NEOP|nr:unnamed protein product [Diatraea saccharalis]
MCSRTPPKCASNPDLPTSAHAEDLYINIRKRKQPEDDNLHLQMKLLEQKMDSQFHTFSSNLDNKITEIINTTLRSTILTEFSKINASLDALNNTVMSLRSDNTSFKESLTSINTRLAEMEKSLSFSNERQETFDKQLQSLQNHMEKNSTLPEHIQILEVKLAAIEQQARDCNIEIVNLPERRNENLCNIITNLGVIIKQQILPSDIISVHRVPHADQKDSRPKNIIAKLSTRILRDNIIAACRSTKNISSEQLGISGSVQRIFINEHLTIQNKRLFRECREKAKLHDYKYVWVKHGVILVATSQRAVQSFKFPQLYAETIIERYSSPNIPLSVSENDLTCKNLASQIQNMVFEKFRSNSNMPIFAPLVNDIKKSMSKCPLCPIVNVNSQSKSYIAPNIVSKMIQASVIPNTITNIPRVKRNIGGKVFTDSSAILNNYNFGFRNVAL